MNIKGKPNVLEFWLQFGDVVSKEKAEAYVFERLVKGLSDGLTQGTSGYIGAPSDGFLMLDLISDIAPYPKGYGELDNKFYRPFRIIFGKRTMFGEILDIPNIKYEAIQNDKGEEYIILKFQDNLVQLYNKHKNLFIEFTDEHKLDKPDIEKGEYAFKGFIKAYTRKRLEELEEMDIVSNSEYPRVRWRHIVLPEFEKKDANSASDVFIVTDKYTLSKHIEEALMINGLIQDPVKFHMHIYRRILSQIPEFLDLVEAYLKTYFS